MFNINLSGARTEIYKENACTAEIVALVKKHPLPSVLDRYGLSESQIALCECLQKFLAVLPAKQQDFMKQVVAMLYSTEV